jgi:imidazolonepropionase-like amidohydrolase
VPEGIAVSELSGKFLTPGLVDAHVHFSQTGWSDGRPDSIDVRAKHPYEEVAADLKAHPERFLRADLCSGVTAVFDVGGFPWTLQLPARADAMGGAPRVKSAGPLLSTIDHWLNLPAERQFILLSDAASATTGVKYLAAHGASAVKVWYIVDDKHTVEQSLDAVRAAGEEARRKGLPLVVHATGLAEAKAALRSGARLLVHSVDDLAVDEEFLQLAKKNGAIYCPTLTVMGGYVRLTAAAARHEAPAIDDPNGCVDAHTRGLLAETAGLDPGRTAEQLAKRDARIAAWIKTSAENLARVRDAGIPIAMGTDAGNPLTLHGPSVYAEMEAMQAAGMTPMEVLVASTRVGATAMGAEKETGTVEKGKAGDLLVLDGDPSADVHAFRKLAAVVRGGTLRTIGELRAVAQAKD